MLIPLRLLRKLRSISTAKPNLLPNPYSHNTWIKKGGSPICEGKHEQGGALEALIRRILRDPAACELVFERWKNPRGVGRRFRKTGKGDGIFKKFVAALFDAEIRGFDAVIGLIDCDREASRIASVDRAQTVAQVALPRAFGVAVQSFDAWFLADEAALAAHFACPVATQPNPEANRDPKAAFRQLRDQASSDLAVTDCYARLAAVADLDIISKRCPTGFHPWRARVSQI